MSEYLSDTNACGSGLSLMLLHRFISKAYEVTGATEPNLTFISHSTQRDSFRILLALMLKCTSCGEPVIPLDDGLLVNPERRIAAWMVNDMMPPGEIRIEHAKGVCRMYNLGTFGVC